jgi:8-oxo-dGTP pyrophosphatase MutT (NUDIX family)
MINSFMYRQETIAAAYEGAGWAFPVETYRDTPHTRVHFQGFEILRHMHFPPTLVLSQILAESLEPNWLPPAEVMADEWGFVKRTEVPYLAEWIEAFDSNHRSFFRRDPAYKSQCRLQRLFKSAQT